MSGPPRASDTADSAPLCAFDQAMLIHMAERIQARITKVSASHAVFMTQPKVVADTIDRAAREAGQQAK